MIKQQKHPVSAALIGAGAIQGLISLLAWGIHGPNFELADWLIISIFAVFFGMGILARWVPLPAALLAAVVYGMFLTWQAQINVKLLTTGLIFKVPVVLLLLAALFFAFRLRRVVKQDAVDSGAVAE